MKRLLLLLRLMVAISMPAAGYLCLASEEGWFWLQGPVNREVRRLAALAEKEPTEANQCRLEGARLVQQRLAAAPNLNVVTTVGGLLVTTTLCVLSINAGRRVKRLMAEAGHAAPSP